MSYIELRNNYFSINYVYEGKHCRISGKEKGWDTRKGIKKSMIKRIEAMEIAKDIERRKHIKEELNRMTIQKYADLFLDTTTLSTKASTAVSKTNRFNNYIVPFFGANKTPEEAITITSITKFVISLGNSETAKAPETRNHILQLFREFLDFLVVQNALKSEISISGKSLCKPFSRAGYHKANEHNYMTPEEFDRVESTFDKHDIMYFIFIISYWGALRIGETLGLKFSDFDFKNHTLTISRQSNKDIHDRLTTCKTSASNATIAIKKSICEEIMRYQREGMFTSDDFLFYRRISRTNINRKLKEHLKLAGITQNVTMHGLRHSMGSRIINSQKFAITQSSKQLRHSSSAVTLSTYAHEFQRIEATELENV